MAVPNFAVKNLIIGLLEAFFVFLLAYLFQNQSLDVGLGFSMFILNLWSFILVALGFALIITPSNETLKETDEFMPVYLKRHEEKVWLREHSLRIIKELTASYQNEMWISTRDDDSLIK